MTEIALYKTLLLLLCMLSTGLVAIADTGQRRGEVICPQLPRGHHPQRARKEVVHQDRRQGHGVIEKGKGRSLEAGHMIGGMITLVLHLIGSQKKCLRRT